MAKKSIPRYESQIVLNQKTNTHFILNNPQLQPFAEVFSFSPENITQQPLGTIFGILKINDINNSNAYIVNFLASLFKKEYFQNVHRTPLEALEAALNRANVALSELAKQGNIQWIGQLEAVVCCLSGDTFHFSVCGDAKILLQRNAQLTIIGEDFSDLAESPHPLKTFSDISLGNLIKDDIIIATTQELMSLFSLEHIQNQINAMSKEKFNRFLHTALINEFDLAATLVLEIKSQEKVTKRHQEQSPNTNKKTRETLIQNAFSERAFEQKSTEKSTYSATNQNHQQTPSTENAIEGDNSGEYIDQKTGHIYIQQDYSVTHHLQADSYWQKNYPLWKESFLNTWENVASKNSLAMKRLARWGAHKWTQIQKAQKETLSKWQQDQRIRMNHQEDLSEMPSITLDENYGDDIILETAQESPKNIAHPIEEASTSLENNLETQNTKQLKKKSLREIRREQIEQKMLERRTKQFESISTSSQQPTKSNTPSEVKEVNQEDKEQLNKLPNFLQRRKASLQHTKDIQRTSPPREHHTNQSIAQMKQKSGVLASAVLKDGNRLLLSIAKNLLPTLKKAYRGCKPFLNIASQKVSEIITRIFAFFASRTSRQRIQLLVAIIIISSIAIASTLLLKNDKKEIAPQSIQAIIPEQSPKETAPTPANPSLNEEQRNLLEEEKNIAFLEDDALAKKDLRANNALTFFSLTNEHFASVTSDTITFSTENGLSSSSFPNKATENIIDATYMEDLNLIFLLTNKSTLYSFSPSNKKFSKESIDIANPMPKAKVFSYLTYIYLADLQKNTITRYPRAEGGFGEGSSWLEETLPLTNTQDIAIDGNVYLAQNEKLIQLFRGKNENISLEQLNTPLKVSQIDANEETEELFILDSQNARIAIYSNTGVFTKQYAHASFTNAIDIQGNNNAITILMKDGHIATFERE